MSHLIELVTTNANKIQVLKDRIHDTFGVRDTSASHRALWKSACTEFHSQYDELFFPGGHQAWTNFVQGTNPNIELALAYLEADPFVFRSGYHKQVIWNRIKQMVLSPNEKQRIEYVALNYLDKRVHWEFWSMAKYVRLRGSSEFWQITTKLASASARSNTAIKAHWLLLFLENQPIRQRIAREFLRAKYQPEYQPMVDFYHQID
jgi:hypothetical protein